ncbi:hypothetical protein Agub_g13399 [Astrephomene gubernaculifera]|uniref:Uncharacterized protein n=1 Tax=Astrephomene gubernaculifera TaxID=47775 RepID=A0AAD3DZX0_9CHLO|nr:hypothetical protein Agub_g13399 [Astrephomene gubernaculifera]
MDNKALSPACAVLLSNVAFFACQNTIVKPLPGNNSAPATSLPGDGEEALGFAELPPPKAPRFDIRHDTVPGSGHSALSGRKDTADVGAEDTNVQSRGWRPGEMWEREQLQLMVRYVASLSPSDPINTRGVIALLGLAELPDPNRAIFNKVKRKLFSVRHQLSNGADPLAGRAQLAGRMAHRTYRWRDWLRGAFLQLPNREGTLHDVAAILESDPDISPKLDRRPDSVAVTVPRWRANMWRFISKVPEVVNTGRKPGRLVVYRYDEEVARQLPGGRGPRVPKKGQQGLPHLGKESN